MVNAELQSMFSRSYGPFGGCPVQLFGQLPTGELVYFRARGRKASLTVYKNKAVVRKYEKFVKVDHPLNAGCMPYEEAAALIKHWVTKYNRHLTGDWKLEPAGRAVLAQHGGLGESFVHARTKALDHQGLVRIGRRKPRHERARYETRWTD